MLRIVNLSIIRKLIGINLLLISGAFLSCIPVALIYKENLLPFLLPSIVCMVPGLLFYFYQSQSQQVRIDKLGRRDAYLIVAVSWVVLGISGSFPYLVLGSIPSVIDAIFESISGFSTTGASILTDIEILPYSIIYWRSLTHWIGGIGIIVLVIAIMPSLKVSGHILFSMESSLQEKIKPRTSSIGYILVLIYISMTILEVVLLLCGGMNLFESVCHAFGTVATGGFSPKNTSIAGYSPYIQYVIMGFMFASGINYSLYYFAVKGKYKKIWINSEFKFYLLVVFSIGMILTITLIATRGLAVEGAFRDAFFNTISIISCTGFAVSDYLLWPSFAVMILFYCMFLGACTGSTTGGIKMGRHLILFKNIRNSFGRVISPNHINVVRINNRPLAGEINHNTLTFVVFYLLVFITATTLISLYNVDLQTAAGSVATCMAGIGPGLGTTGPVANFGHLPNFVKIVLSVVMLLGRLEFYTVIILFSKSFWKY